MKFLTFESNLATAVLMTVYWLGSFLFNRVSHTTIITLRLPYFHLRLDTAHWDSAESMGVICFILKFQTFGNVNVTGELNRETRELMKRPRCGVPDILSGQFRGNRRRRKRFIIQGQKWPNTNLTWR